MAGLLDMLPQNIAGQIADKRGLGDLSGVQAPSGGSGTLGGFPVPQGLTPQTSLEVPNGLQGPAPSFAPPASPAPPDFAPPPFAGGNFAPPPFQGGGFPGVGPQGGLLGGGPPQGAFSGVMPQIGLDTNPAAYRAQMISRLQQALPSLPDWMQQRIRARFGWPS